MVEPGWKKSAERDSKGMMNEMMWSPQEVLVHV